MKKHFFLFVMSGLTAFLLCGCISYSHIATTSGVQVKDLSEIPAGSKTIIVYKDNVSGSDLYEEVYSILIKRGHRISKDDEKRHYLTTEGRDVGQSTLQRMTIVVTENETYSQMRISTEWKGGTEAAAMATAMGGIPVQSNWATAKWEVNRLGIAFAESVAIAKAIPNSRISYR